MPKTSSAHKRQSPEYYESVLRHLIQMNNKTFTYSEMATHLNELEILTPTGLQWHSDHIKNLLKKLRNFKTTPSFIAQHLLEMIFEDKLTLKESLPLFQSRRHGVK